MRTANARLNALLRRNPFSQTLWKRKSLESRKRVSGPRSISALAWRTLLLAAACLLVGLGVQEKAREMLDEMVDKGKISRDEGDTLLNKFMGQAETSVDTMEEKFKELVASTLSSMDLPSKKDLQELRDQVALLQELRDQVALLQKSLDKMQGG